jgi:hypothetical protein
MEPLRSHALFVVFFKTYDVSLLPPPKRPPPRTPNRDGVENPLWKGPDVDETTEKLDRNTIREGNRRIMVTSIYIYNFVQCTR